jgi:hypothetical protein
MVLPDLLPLMRIILEFLEVYEGSFKDQYANNSIDGDEEIS